MGVGTYVTISDSYMKQKTLWPLEWHKSAKLKLLVRVQPVSSCRNTRKII